MRRAGIALAACLTLLSLGVFTYTVIHSVAYAPDSSGRTASEAATSTSSSHPPARLVIPRLEIDATVEYLGVNAVGNMQAPSNFADVGWYRYGTIPGDMGSAVMDGHVDNGLGLAGVFKRLNELVPGDDIYVVMTEGTMHHFTVKEVASYPYRLVPTDVLFNRADKARLNLVTCEGRWIGNERTYDHRRVVYAVLSP